MNNLALSIVSNLKFFNCIDLCCLCCLNKECNLLFSSDYFWKDLDLFRLDKYENIKNQYKNIFLSSYPITYAKKMCIYEIHDIYSGYRMRELRGLNKLMKDSTRFIKFYVKKIDIETIMHIEGLYFLNHKVELLTFNFLIEYSLSRYKRVTKVTSINSYVCHDLIFIQLDHEIIPREGFNMINFEEIEKAGGLKFLLNFHTLDLTKCHWKIIFNSFVKSLLTIGMFCDIKLINISSTELYKVSMITEANGVIYNDMYCNCSIFTLIMEYKNGYISYYIVKTNDFIERGVVAYALTIEGLKINNFILTEMLKK